jgi:hypothetical protein
VPGNVGDSVRYVDTVAAGTETTSVHQELTRFLENYCTSDVAELIKLYTTLNGPDLDNTYRCTAAQIT